MAVAPDPNGTTATATAKGLSAALLAFQAEAISLQKDAEATVTSAKGSYKYKYVTLKSLLKIVLPKLTEHGLLWKTMPTIADGQPALAYTLTHVPSGETDDGVMPLYLSQQSPQAHGAAISYARRYAMTAVLGLVGEDDGDGKVPGGRRATTSMLSRGQLEALKGAAAGLPVREIKTVLTIAGYSHGPTPAAIFANVPPENVADLCAALTERERES